MTQVIERAVELAKTVHSEKIQIEKARLVKLSKEIEASKPKGFRRLLPVYGLERVALDRANREKKAIEQWLSLSSRFRELSPEPFTWRNDQGYPLLVPYVLDEPYFEMEVKKVHYAGDDEAKVTNNLAPRNERWPYSPLLHPLVQPQFEDVFQVLARQTSVPKNGWADIVLKSTFDQLIPREIKTQIRTVKKQFEQILIVAEPNFILEKREVELPIVPGVRNPDPLVVGVAASTLWLITSFNATPIEKRMALYSTAKSRN